ncbi:MAG: thioredoxin domain-containing protein [Bacteroidia bacterium]|nr:thioredoxin domain-containing protein [Bacteroidia bacterium]MDW8334464.1 thioredoxin domain-containing protein [Bacteroidia bacterium]
MKTFAIGAVVVGWFATGLYAQEGVKFFEGDWNALLSQAKKTGKPFFVDFYATWCGPCKMMKKTTFMDADVAQFANKHFLAYMVDTDKNRDLSSQYRIRVLPTVVFFDAGGKEIGRFEGYKGSADFLAELQKYAPKTTGSKSKSVEEQDATIEDYLRLKASVVETLDELAFAGVRKEIAQAYDYGRKKSDFEYEEYRKDALKNIGQERQWLLDAFYALGAKRYDEFFRLVNESFEAGKLSNAMLHRFAWYAMETPTVPSEALRWINHVIRVAPSYELYDSKAALQLKADKDPSETIELALKTAKAQNADPRKTLILKQLTKQKSEAKTG